MKQAQENLQSQKLNQKQTLFINQNCGKSSFLFHKNNATVNSENVKARGISIEKKYNSKVCEHQTNKKTSYFELSTQKNYKKKLSDSHEKSFQGNSKYKIFNRIDSEQISDGLKKNSQQIPILSFSKTPKSSRVQKTSSRAIQFSLNCSEKQRSAYQTSQGRSTQNTEKLDHFNKLPILNFKTNQKMSLSHFVNKSTCHIQTYKTSSKHFSYIRKLSLSSHQQPNHTSNTNIGADGLPTHSDTRQIGGGTFSHSYPTNNPFLKFKLSESTIIEQSEISNINFSQSSSKSRIDSIKKFSSKASIMEVRKKTIKKEDFQIGKRLGKGKYGDVFLVRHYYLGFICAMKIIEKELVRRQGVETQICRQMKISQYISHPNVTTLYGYFDDQKNVYFLMQLCSDGNLFKVLKEKKRFSQRQSVTAINQLCRGVEYLHRQNIIHRDIKPENVIIENGILKICDFGWAVVYEDKLRSTFCGTPLYISPEVLKGNSYGHKIDIWAIGILTYQLLIGRVPFRISSEADMAKIIYDQIIFPPHVAISNLAKEFILMILDRSPESRVDIQQVLQHDFLKQEHSSHFLLQ